MFASQLICSCPNHHCSNAVVVDGETTKKLYCPDCSTDLNSQPTLIQEETENEEKFQEYVKNTNSRLCPAQGCGAVISRTFGCDHMQCTSCRTRFCYACGRTGDTNGFPCPSLCNRGNDSTAENPDARVDPNHNGAYIDLAMDEVGVDPDVGAGQNVGGELFSYPRRDNDGV